MEQIRIRDGRLELEPFDCICGRRHALPIPRVFVGPGALARVGPTLAELGLGKRPLLVSDDNTHEAAGEAVMEQIAATRPVRRCHFATREPIAPDESSVGHLLLSIESDTDLLVVAGSGCLTDVTRFASFRTGVPFVSVATAPSMDGYASNGAPMTHRGFKRTYYCSHAQALFADTDVLGRAPHEMVAAGFGDTVAKLLSRIDWRLARLVTGEYYCPVLASAIDELAAGCLASAGAIGDGKPDAIRMLTEALIVSGIGMLIVGNSRPASGTEHSFAHYWEMKAALDGATQHLHGTKVGVASIVTAALFDAFFSRDASVDPSDVVRRRESPESTEAGVRRLLGPVAESVITEVTRPFRRGDEALVREIELIRRSWGEIVEIGAGRPAPESLAQALQAAGGAHTIAGIDVTPGSLRETLFVAKEVRSRYTVLRAAESLGWLPELIDETVATLSRLGIV